VEKCTDKTVDRANEDEADNNMDVDEDNDDDDKDKKVSFLLICISAEKFTDKFST
jgi:hypothetical protein